MPFSVALRVLPGAVQASLAAGAGAAAAGAAGAVAAGSAEQGGSGREGEAATAAAALSAAGEGAGGGVYGHVARALPLVRVGLLMMAYVKLLTVKNGQLEDDVRILKGLKVCERGRELHGAQGDGGQIGIGGMSGLSEPRTFLETNTLWDEMFAEKSQSRVDGRNRLVQERIRPLRKPEMIYQR